MANAEREFVNGAVARQRDRCQQPGKPVFARSRPSLLTGHPAGLYWRWMGAAPTWLF
uniref:Uncharacterized protein n=1 Tax=Peronospora matthiolae TaxID=2874970 RepID=A0AAV1UMU4_9STRA